MFQDALTHIIAQLEQAKDQGLLQDFGLVGGLAIAAWGTPRATQDIDFAIALGGAQPFNLSKFLGGTYEEGDLDDPLRGVFRVHSQQETQQVPIQLIMLPSVWSPVLFSCLVPQSSGICYSELQEVDLWGIYTMLTPRRRHESEKKFKTLQRRSLGLPNACR